MKYKKKSYEVKKSYEEEKKRKKYVFHNFFITELLVTI